MKIKDYDVYKRDGCRITPNSFSINLQIRDEKNAFIMSFGSLDNKEKRVDILTEIILTEDGFKSVFNRMMEVSVEYKEKTNIDLWQQILDEIKGEIENE